MGLPIVPIQPLAVIRNESFVKVGPHCRSLVIMKIGYKHMSAWKRRGTGHSPLPEKDKNSINLVTTKLVG